MEEPNKTLHYQNDLSRWTSSKPVKRRSSLFGKTFNWKDQTTSKPLNEPNTEEDIEKYHKQIHDELKAWDNFFLQKSANVGYMNKVELVADETVLTEESSNYILTGMNLLREYVGGLENAKRLLNFYLEERMALLEAKNDLNYHLNQIADEETANIIEDTLEE